MADDDDTKTILGFIREGQSRIEEKVTKMADDYETHIRDSIKRKGDQDFEIANANRSSGEAKKEIKDHKEDHEKTREKISKVVWTLITALLVAAVLTYLGLR